VGDLEVEEVGGVECLAGRGQSIGDARARRGVEEDLQHGGCVDHDHLRSRSALTALAGATRGATGVR